VTDIYNLLRFKQINTLPTLLKERVNKAFTTFYNETIGVEFMNKMFKLNLLRINFFSNALELGGNNDRLYQNLNQVSTEQESSQLIKEYACLMIELSKGQLSLPKPE